MRKRSDKENNEDKADDIDLFQIFEQELDLVKKNLGIKYKQEQPSCEKDHVFFNIEVNTAKEYTGKIYIIDNEINGMTMM